MTESKRNKTVVLSLASIVLLAAAALWLRSYLTPQPFKGAAELIYHGWTYPSYEVRFPEIAIEDGKEQIFECSGLPSNQYYFCLDIVDYSLNKETGYRDFATKVTVFCRIEEAEGAVLYESEKSLAQWDLSSAFAFGRWHPSIASRKYSNAKAYKITLRFKVNDSSSLRVVPMLEGGGSEW